LTETNIEKLRRLLEGITITEPMVGGGTKLLINDGFNLNTNGGFIKTSNGDIFTGNASYSTGGGGIYTGGGRISTMGGEILTGGGDITVGVGGRIYSPYINVENLHAIGTDATISVNDHMAINSAKILTVKHLQMPSKPSSDSVNFMDIRNTNGFVVARFSPPAQNNIDYGQISLWRSGNDNYKYIAFKDGTGIAS
jgi:hypothetical protein